MPAVDHQRDGDESNRASADLDKALEHKREDIAAALNDAPQGRHRQELDALADVQQQLANRCAEPDRTKVDAFFEEQRTELEQVQRAELELGSKALASATSGADLAQAIEVIGEMHRVEHERLAAERSALEQALAAGFAEQPGNLWTAAEVEERLAAGKVDELGKMDAARQAAPRSADEATNPNSHQRGNFGERAATEALAAQGFQILDYKPDLKGTTKPGIDMVAMKDDQVYLIDNKALSRSGDVYAVSALTTNLADRADREGNLSKTVQALEDMAQDTRRSTEELDVINRALTALEAGRYVLAVTNANVAADDRILRDASDRLKEQGIEFIRVMEKPQEKEQEKKEELST